LGDKMGGLNQSSTNQNQLSTVNAQLNPWGQQAGVTTSNALGNYTGLAGQQSAINANAPGQYSQMLQNYANGGFLPNATQIGAANNYAQQQFAPQQAALNNTFTQAQMNVAQQAAAMGRPTTDPILQARLAQYQGQQQQVLSGQQTALGSQVAMQMPQQQLGFAQQLSNQAFQNQANVMGLGQNLLSSQQQYALGTASRNNAGTGTSTPGFLSTLFNSLGAVAGGFGLVNSLSGGSSPGLSGLSQGGSSSPYPMGSVSDISGMGGVDQVGGDDFAIAGDQGEMGAGAGAMAGEGGGIDAFGGIGSLAALA
jgi:hypothetical protein